MSINNDYTTGNLLDYSYNQNYYKPIAKDLSRQTYTTIPQHINFTGKLAMRQCFLYARYNKKLF